MLSLVSRETNSAFVLGFSIQSNSEYQATGPNIIEGFAKVHSLNPGLRPVGKNFVSGINQGIGTAV